MTQYWLCYGRKDKWEGTLNHNKWGVVELAVNGRVSGPAQDWERVTPGDFAIFMMGRDRYYGWGVVTDKSDQETEPIWPDELKEQKVIYNRRFSVSFIAHITKDREVVELPLLNPPGGAGLSVIAENEALQVIDLMKKQWVLI